MRQSLARYSATVSFVHAPSLADFITTIVGFEVFGTHTHANPVDRLSSPQRVSKAVERVSHHSVEALHARLLEGFDQIFGSSFAHKLLFPIARTSPRMRAVDLPSRG